MTTGPPAISAVNTWEGPRGGEGPSLPWPGKDSTEQRWQEAKTLQKKNFMDIVKRKNKKLLFFLLQLIFISFKIQGV